MGDKTLEEAELLDTHNPPVRSVLTLCGEDSLAFHLTCRMPCWWWRMWYWLLLGWKWRLPKEGGTCDEPS